MRGGSLQDRRKFIRLAMRAPIKAMVPGKPAEPYEGVLFDIAKSGFSFLSEDEFQRGHRYSFDIAFFGNPMKVEGTVVHVEKKETYSHYGIKFYELPFSQRMKLNKILASQTPSYRVRFSTYSLAGGAVAFLLAKILFGISLGFSLFVFSIVFIILFTFLPF